MDRPDDNSAGWARAIFMTCLFIVIGIVELRVIVFLIRVLSSET